MDIRQKIVGAALAKTPAASPIAKISPLRVSPLARPARTLRGMATQLAMTPATTTQNSSIKLSDLSRAASVGISLLKSMPHLRPTAENDANIAATAARSAPSANGGRLKLSKSPNPPVWLAMTKPTPKNAKSVKPSVAWLSLLNRFSLRKSHAVRSITKMGDISYSMAVTEMSMNRADRANMA